MTKPSNIALRIIADLEEDIQVLHKVKLALSSKSTHLVQYIIDEHMAYVKHLCTANNFPLPDWVTE